MSVKGPLRRYRVTLTVLAPFLTVSTASGRYGLDAVAARSYDGRWMIAGTHLSGKLYQALEELHEATDGEFDPHRETLSLFRVRDAELEHTDADDFSRSRIHIGDLTTAQTGNPAGEHTRIAVDEVSGVALEGALQTVQEPFAAGEEVYFEGPMTILARSADFKEHEHRLRKALQWIPQIGSGRTVGMGRVLKAKLLADTSELATPFLAPSVAPASSADRYRLILSFEEGFCCAAPQRHRNVFASGSFVPGGAIKGAIAAQMLAMAGKPTSGDAREAGTAYPQLAKYLDKIRIARAFPAALMDSGALAQTGAAELSVAASVPERPRIPPLSLAAIRGRLFDFALDAVCAPVTGIAPSFRADWKGGIVAKAEALTGWHEPKRELRVRTRMSRVHRAAESENLFAIETVVPQGCVWLGEIDLAGCPDDATRAGAREDIESLLQGGLYGIGKTNAFACVFLTPLPDAPPPGLAKGELAIVTLQAPALLLPPEPDNLLRNYAHAFRTLAESAACVGVGSTEKAKVRGRHALELTGIFTQEAYTGGMYVAMRVFRGREAAYRPLLFSNPGSVFVFKVCDPVAAARVLAHWHRHGLDVPPDVLQAYLVEPEQRGDGEPNRAAASGWRGFPFVPQNGFGEVMINDPLHWAMRPHPRAVFEDEP